MSFKGEVIGAEELSKTLTGLAEEVRRNTLDAALMAGATPLLSAMKAAASVSENGSRGNRLTSRNHPAGTLKRSIKILKSREGNFPTIWVKPVKGQGDPDGWYAKFVEYGHFVRKGNKGVKGKIKKGQHVTFVKARPFIRPTYDSMDGTVKAIISERIMSEVEKYVKQ
jgi:HK97 gp10 family phage protein